MEFKGSVRSTWNRKKNCDFGAFSKIDDFHEKMSKPCVILFCVKKWSKKDISIIFFPVKADIPYFSDSQMKSEMAPIKWRQFWFEWQWFSWKIMKLSKNTFLAPFPLVMLLAPFWRQKWKFRPIFDLGPTGFALIPRIATSNREFPNFRFRSWHDMIYHRETLDFFMIHFWWPKRHFRV